MKKVWRIILVTLLVFAMLTSIFTSENSAKGGKQ